MKIKYTKNKAQEEFHADTDTKFLHLSGGIGCIDPTANIFTDSGFKSFGDLKDSDLVLSLSNGGVAWSECLGAFPKAKGQIYRIVHDEGESLVFGSHLLACSDHSYRRALDLKIGDRLCGLEALPNLQSKHPLDGPISSHANDLHSMRKSSGSRNDCLAYRHQHDRQLRSVEGFDQCHAIQPSYGGGHVHGASPLNWLEQGRAYSRLGRSKIRHSKMGFYHQEAVLALASGDCISEDISAQSWPHSQRLQLSTSSEFLFQRRELFEPSSQSLPLTIIESAVRSIEKIKTDWYWDTHVFGTNNYFADGCFHHNSGKSHALIMKMFQLSWVNKDLPGGLICPTYTDFKRDLYPLIEEISINSGLKIDFHGQDHYYTLPWSRSKLYVATGERKIRGPNWAYAAINELTLIPKERYLDVIGRVRLRKARQPQIVSCGTPEGISSQYYETFISNPMKGSRVIYASTRDNQANLGVDYVESLENSFDELARKAYLEGMWINMNGSLFYYAYSPDKNTWKGIENEDMPVHVGIDFNVDPMTATIWQYDGVKLRGIDEITIGGLVGGADTKMLATALIKRGYGPHRAVLYPDPAGNARSTKGQPDIEVLRQAGFYQIKVKSKAPGMRQRQLNVNNLLSKGIILINTEKQPEMKKEFEGVEQDKVTLEKKKDNPKRTHHSDGLDYLCDHLFPFNIKRTESRIQNVR